jgi:tetratricopeptide (TPR) repeat protein
MMTSGVVDLAARCAVAIYGGGQFLGSGFLVAPGQVLTCAHVAAEGGPGPLTVRLADTELTASHVQLMPSQPEPGRRTYAAPDLALITVDAQPDQPSVWLADHGPDTGSDVLCLGFSDATTEVGTAPDSVRLEVAAAGGGGFIRVQQGEIPRGMSGGLVLDLGTHRVCGLVKASRDTDAPRGGWIIPVSMIAGNLAGVVEQNMACHGTTSHWRQLATRHAEFARCLFGSRSPLRIADPPGNVPPSWWLDPRHRATRFQERPELESLLAWAGDENPGTAVARLVTGEGGSGKTRLAVELAARLAARGWIAGILTADDLGRLPQIAEALHEILAYGHKVFIALDYPEGMGDELTRFLAQLPLPDEGIVRVLLLARFGGDWWSTLHPAGEIKYLIDSTPIQLTPLYRDPDATAGRFAEVLQDYRLKILGSDAPGARAEASTAVPTALAMAALQHGIAIKLHALALVSALHERDHGALPDGEVAWADPLGSLVDHERRHWAEAARGRALSCAGDPVWAGRILLVPTLLGVYRSEEGCAAISRIPGFADRFPGEAADSAALLRDLYPPDESASIRWWSPLPLDRLGETLLAAVLGSLQNEATAYVTALLRTVSLPEAIQGLTVLSRLSADPETTSAVRATLSRCQGALATAEDSRLLPALLVADRQIPPGIQRPGERHLAQLDLGSAMNLIQLLNRKSVPRLLQETGLALLDHADRILDTDEMRFKGVPIPVRELVASMRDMGTDIPMESAVQIVAKALRAELLMRLGRAGEAIGPAEAAADAMRAVHRASSGQGPLFDGDLLVFGAEVSGDPAAFLKVLRIYAEALHTVGRLAESAEIRRECVAVARHVAGTGGPDSGSDLVARLYDLTEALLELGQPEQAELCAREAAERARSLPGLTRQAATLAIRAKALDRAGRTAEARAVADDAVRVLQQDDGSTADRAVTEQVIRVLGHLAPPGAAAPDPLADLREAASRDPAAALPELVFAALARADHLAGQQDLEGASRHMSEALGHARRLAAEDPHTNLRVLGHVLVKGTQLGCSAEPAAEIAEAVRIYRRMVDEWGREDMRADLALALMQQAVTLRDAGRDADSLPGFAAAIELLRPLLTQDRWRNTPYLCSALALFAETATIHGDPEQAVAAAREAIDLAISRTDDLPPAPAEHLPKLRHILFVALVRLLSTRADMSEDPAVMAAATAEIRQVAPTLPAGTFTGGDRWMLAGSLALLGSTYSGSGRPEDAAPPLAEALGILRGATGTDSGEPDPALLFRVSMDLLSIYRTLGRHAETADTTAEILADCRRIQPLWEQQRYDCMLTASEVIEELPRPGYTAEALRLAIAHARTCREWLPSGGIGRVLSHTAVIQLSHNLAKAMTGGIAPDDWPAAVLEISAGAALVAEHPGLLRAEHAHAVAQAASVLAATGRLGDALELNTRALELHQSLACRDDASDPLPGIASLVQQGVLLSAVERPGDAIGPLEQALPVLLASGPDISRAQAMLLRSTIDLLRRAYRSLNRDGAEQALIDAFNASGVPPVVSAGQTTRKTGADLHATLQAAQDEATTDPERIVAVFRELLLSPAGGGEYLIARDTCGRVITMLTSAGHFPGALSLCDLLITSGADVGLTDWAQIDGKSRKLNVQLDAGTDPQAVLAEATALTTRAEELTAEPGSRDAPDLRWAHETLLRVSARAALHLGQWPDALQFTQAEADAMRRRGAPRREVAIAEFNSFSALDGMGRTAEAEELLDRCEAAFREDPQEQDLHLGLVSMARADLAAKSGDPGRAVRLQSEALARVYQSGEARQIIRGHEALGSWHAQADPHSPFALAHALAAAMLAELAGQPPDIESITRMMYLRGGEYPATPAVLCAVLDETPGLRFAELLETLCRNRPAPTASETMAGLVRRARDGEPYRYLFDKMAEHRMRWDPVFAGMVLASQEGDLAVARAVRETLSDYAGDADWSQLSLALGYVFHQSPDAASAVALDDIDAVLLRRCTDALDGTVYIPLELVYAMPVNNVLAEVLFSAQNGQTSPNLARALEGLARKSKWQPLVGAIRKILAGERDPRMTSGLDQNLTVIITALLGYLTAP